MNSFQIPRSARYTINTASNSSYAEVLRRRKVRKVECLVGLQEPTHSAQQAECQEAPGHSISAQEEVLVDQEASPSVTQKASSQTSSGHHKWAGLAMMIWAVYQASLDLVARGWAEWEAERGRGRADLRT